MSETYISKNLLGTLYKLWKERKTQKFKDLYGAFIKALSSLQFFTTIDSHNPDHLKYYHKIFTEQVQNVAIDLHYLGIKTPTPIPIIFESSDLRMVVCNWQIFLEDVVELSRQGDLRKARSLLGNLGY